MVSSVPTLPILKAPRILIGRSGLNGPFGEIAEALREKGYPVTEWKSPRIGAHSTEVDVQQQVKDVDLAFLVVRATDDMDKGGDIRPLHRILVEAGLMQGTVGFDRVILLVEEGVDGLSPAAGLSYIRFSADRPWALVRELLSKIETMFPTEDHEEQGVLTAVDVDPVVDEPSSPKSNTESQPLQVATRLALAVFAVGLAVLAAIAIIAWPDSDTSRLGPGFASQALGVHDGIDLTEDRSEAIIGQDPASPEVARDGDGQLFPATCQLNLRRGSLIDGAVRCEGAGQLTVEGYVGPWHNDVFAVAASEGVGATIEYELRDDGTTNGPSVVDVGVGTTLLNTADASFGIGTVFLRFSGQGQHFHLFQADAAGGESVTLTFSLDR